MNKTNIAWTDYTWNPVTGCSPISEGCQNCYAAAINRPFHLPQKIQFHPERLDEPLRLKQPCMIFTGSMTDLFHKDVPFKYIDQIMAVIAICQQHTFQVLTKRADRMLEYFNRLSQDSVYSPSDFLKDAFFDSVYYRKTGERLEKKKDDSFDLWFDEITTLLECHAWPFPNLWLGVTAENQRWADERIPTLLQIPAAVRFMSLEPLLGEMQIAKYLSEYKFRQDYCNKQSCGGCVFPRGHNLVTDGPCLGSKNWTENKNKVDWVIVGAETGPDGGSASWNGCGLLCSSARRRACRVL